MKIFLALLLMFVALASQASAKPVFEERQLIPHPTFVCTQISFKFKFLNSIFFFSCLRMVVYQCVVLFRSFVSPGK